MENYNREFFDEYTRLDNVCRQMFNTEKGVTEYINSMESTAYAKSRGVPDWDSDLRMLKQYRHIRNRLAHTPGAFRQDICVQYDVTWIMMFRERILKRKDPLAVLFRQARVQKSGQKAKPVVVTPKKHTKKRKIVLSDRARTLLMIGGALALIVIIILINRG